MASERKLRSICKVDDAGEMLCIAPAMNELYRNLFTHITLPLDASLYDDAAVEATDGAYWHGVVFGDRTNADVNMRAAIAAYAKHVAGGAK